ncbi:unnamed protein product [Cylicostephanus goldi]|uniref:Uncharacterized protein n=1 Tax=Cylicostephanus goldi TaxID=71465 RepID=A0A3P6QLW3_CYLGO|nr:unnamed protein product [Cylicostephanus goldi]
MTSAEVDSAVVANSKDSIEPQLPDSGNASVSGSPDCVHTNGEVAEADGAAKGPPQETVFSLTIQPTVGDSFDLQVGIQLTKSVRCFSSLGCLYVFYCKF